MYRNYLSRNYETECAENEPHDDHDSKSEYRNPNLEDEDLSEGDQEPYDPFVLDNLSRMFSASSTGIRPRWTSSCKNTPAHTASYPSNVVGLV
jgi:hypothetical protein